MDKIQHAQRKSLQTTETYLEENEAVVRIIPAFSEAFADFRTLMRSLDAAVEAEEATEERHSAAKAARRTAVQTRHLSIAAALFARAHKRKESGLLKKYSWTETRLRDLREAVLVAEAKALLADARADVAALAPYNIDTAALDAFDADIRVFQLLLPKPRSARADKKQQSTEVDRLLRTTLDHARNQLDKLALPFKNTHPGFYAGYGQARTIVDAATRPTAISLQVLDARTEAPLAGARITLGSLELTTNERGRFTLKDIEPGTHTIRVGKEGYGEKMVEGVEVKVGKTKKVKVGLEAR